MALNPASKSTPAYILLYSDMQILRKPKENKPTIGQLQLSVFKRMADHAGNIFTSNAIADVDWAIKKLCKRNSRYSALEQLAVMPLTDILELSYLLNNKIFFRHISKFSVFYKALKIKNIKNRHIPIKHDSSSLVPVAELSIRINHVSINTSAQSNFLLDFGFVESVGSVLL